MIMIIKENLMMIVTYFLTFAIGIGVGAAITDMIQRRTGNESMDNK